MKTLKEREVILQNPITGTYDAAYIVKEMEVKQYGVHTDDHDFHVSYFDAYNSKAEAVIAMKKDEEWAYTMGDNKYFYVTTRTIIVKRSFDIDMAKRNSRARAKREYITPLKRIAKAHGFDEAIELLAVGLYYPAKTEDDLPPLTEDYIERADKVYFIRVNKDGKEYLLFNLDDRGMTSQAIEVKNFELAGGHFRWSKYSDILPWINGESANFDFEEPCFDQGDIPDFNFGL